jgi:hypothetical protein
MTRYIMNFDSLEQKDLILISSGTHNSGIEDILIKPDGFVGGIGPNPLFS